MLGDEQQTEARIAARNRFLAACSLTGAATTAYHGPREGPDEETFWIDIARLGSPDADRVLVLSCGFNGAEGHCGAAIMTGWLTQGLQRELPRDVGIVLIHAVLPAGQGAGSASAPEKAVKQGWSDNVLSAAARRFASYAESKGPESSAEAATAPPAEDPTAWLTEASNAVADEIVEQARHIGLIEFHTSLRPYGDVAIASCHPAARPADRRVETWFGDKTGAREDGPAVLDIFALGFGDRMADLSLTAVNVDFGVYSTRAILGLEAGKSTAERRADMRNIFFPESENWREFVHGEGARIIGEAIRGLAAT